MNILLLTLNLLAATLIVLYGVFSVINAMTHATSHGMRLAWVVLTTGALGVLLAPLFDKPMPPAPLTAVLVGVALHILCDRRSPIWRILQ